MIHEGLTDAFHDIHMGITAENLVERYGITREEQDAFAAESQARAAAAIARGGSRHEIVPVDDPAEEGRGEALRHRRAPARGHHRGVSGQAEGRLQEGRHRSPRGTRAGSTTGRPRWWSRAPSGRRASGRSRVARDRGLRLGGRGPEGDGHRSRAGGAKGAREGRARHRRDRPLRAERGLRRPGAGRGCAS